MCSENYFTYDVSTTNRLDVFLNLKMEAFSRAHIQKLINEGFVEVNGEVKKSNYKLKMEDLIKVTIPSPKPLEVIPQNIPLNIIYEDKDVIVIDKPQGMVVHPASGVYEGTLVNALLYHCKDLSGINGVLRPGIVHRIDKDTSGVLVVAKNDISHRDLAEQLKNHTMNRVYTAVVEGVIKNDFGTIDASLGRHPKDRIKFAVVNNGKRAVTHYTVLERFKQNTLINCKLETGRTHQIRVHMAYVGHPLIGDPVYGFAKQKFHLEGQTLHASLLGFIHPTTKEYMEFNSPLPEYFTNVINILRRG